MKIHCGQMVEGALRSALEEDTEGEDPDPQAPVDTGTLAGSLGSTKKGKVRIVKLDEG